MKKTLSYMDPFRKLCDEIGKGASAQKRRKKGVGVFPFSFRCRSSLSLSLLSPPLSLSLSLSPSKPDELCVLPNLLEARSCCLVVLRGVWFPGREGEEEEG